MRTLVVSNSDKCVGCNRCTRSCPIEAANITAMNKDGSIKVDIDPDKCIACGACISACKHGAREYVDDTERFINDLQNGTPISLIVAPAFRANFSGAGRLFTWLKNLGAQKIYDVSLGADICTWAHIRYIQKNNPESVITQPCPVIVNYCLMYRPNILKYLSPVHSPMLCTAVYMKQYEKIDTRIAAISPCIAKSHEFDSTRLVHYNVTFKRLVEYIESHNIRLPQEETGFDHYDSGLGSLYSMPGGLKENVEFFLGKSLRIDKSEGQDIVYRALDEFEKQPLNRLPDIFDVLNCAEGCNAGTGCIHSANIFEINTAMDNARKEAVNNRDTSYFDELYKNYDEMLQLSHFLRHYTASPVHIPAVSDQNIEQALIMMGKDTKEKRELDCGACGSNTCYEMAKKIALGVNIPTNCIQKVREDIKADHDKLINIQQANLKNVTQISGDIDDIKEYTDTIVSHIKTVDSSIAEYSSMAKIINDIAMQINIIAVNASIEAARAGMHGRAFSVISSEIRSLAETSKKTVSASEEISSSAEESMGGVNETITQILTAVQTAQNDINEIIKHH